MKSFFFKIEDLGWSVRCKYNLWLHGPYGLSKVIERMPFKFLTKYLRKYGATIGENCRFERGINLHRPDNKRPYKNLIIGDNVYLGHNTLIDLTKEVKFNNGVIVASRCQFWTHASYYDKEGNYNEKKKPIEVFQNAIVYSNCIITHGVNIGERSRVGAQSLVNKSIQNDIFVGGVPIKEIEL